MKSTAPPVIEDSRGLSALAPVFLILAIAVAYSGSFSGSFVFDDVRTLAENASIRRFSTALFPPANGMTTSGRPLVNLSFAVNYAISGHEVWSYHAFNVLIHILAALTFFGLVRRTLSTRPFAVSVAFSAALLWSLHPIQTEAVTYLVQRTESLCSLFFLLVLYCFARAHSQGEEQGRRSRSWQIASVLACFAAVACKEIAVVAPIIVLLYDRTFIAGKFTTALRSRPIYYAALASSWLLLAMLAIRAGDRGGSAGFQTEISPVSYAFTQVVAVPHYLGLVIYPHPLVFDYGTSTVDAAGTLIPCALLVLSLLAATVILLRRAPASGFLAASFFLLLAPSSSILPIATQTMAEHRLYLPLAAITPCLALAFLRLYRRQALAVVILLSAPLALATLSRNRDYQTAESLWADTVAKVPTNPRASYNLGLVRMADNRAGEAVTDFQRALEMRASYPQAHDALGLALAKAGHLDEAIDHGREAVRLAPHLAAPRINLGAALALAGREEDAIAIYESAVPLEPAEADLHTQIALLLSRRGRTGEALLHFDAAVRLDPASASTLANLANALLLLGRTDEAIPRYEAALRLAPGDERIRSNLDLARRSLLQRP